MRLTRREARISPVARRIACVACLFLLPSWGRGELLFDQSTVELGRVRSIGTIEQAFSFRVTGDRPAEIVQIRPSCGCVRPSLEKRIFAPGERGEIVLGVHATGQAPGRHDYRLSLTVRDPVERTVDLVMSLELYSEIVVQPAQVLVYSNGKKPLVQTVTITDTRARQPAASGGAPRELEVTGLVSSSKRLEARLRGTGEEEQQGVRRLDLVIGTDFPIGKTEERIAVTTNDSQYPAFEIPVLVVRSARIQCAPDSLSIDTRAAAPGEPITRLLILTDREGAPIEIASVRCDLAGVQCQWPREAAKHPRVSIRLDPPAKSPANGQAASAGDPGRRIGRVLIQLRRPVPLELSVPVTLD